MSGPAQDGPEPADPRATQRITELDLGRTQRVQVADLPHTGGAGAPLRIQKADEPALAAGQATPGPLAAPAAARASWILPAFMLGLAGLGLTAYLLLSRRGAPEARPAQGPGSTSPEPPGAGIYLEKARAGDPHAMRMLGVIYYYGLNVPQDRAKGLYWYRMAAEKGSTAAQAELAKLEGKS